MALLHGLRIEYNDYFVRIAFNNVENQFAQEILQKLQYYRRNQFKKNPDVRQKIAQY